MRRRLSLPRRGITCELRQEERADRRPTGGLWRQEEGRHQGRGWGGTDTYTCFLQRRRGSCIPQEPPQVLYVQQRGDNPQAPTGSVGGIPRKVRRRKWQWAPLQGHGRTACGRRQPGASMLPSGPP